MFRREKCLIVVCVLYLLSCTFYYPAPISAQDEKVVERYKLMLSRNPKEGSTFDRLYQFYLEGDGLDAMVADYQAAAAAKPNDSNLQLILGHIHKRLGKMLRRLLHINVPLNSHQTTIIPISPWDRCTQPCVGMRTRFTN